MAKSFSTDYADEIIDNTIQENRFVASIQLTNKSILAGGENAIMSILTKVDPTAPDKYPEIKKRFNEVFAQINEKLSGTYADILKNTEGGMSGLIELAYNKMGKDIDTWFGKGIAEKLMTKGDISEMLKTFSFDGKSLAQHFEDQRRLLMNTLKQELKPGVGNLGDLINTIKGAKGKKAALDKAKRNLKTLTKTAMAKASTDAKMKYYQDNAKMIKALQLIATLDSRTTPLCRSLHGGIYTVKGKTPIPPTVMPWPLGGSGPPFHYNCRTIVVPIYKNLDDMGGSLSKAKKDKLDKLEASKKSALDATYKTPSPSYTDWLKKQPEKVQIEALGPKRWKLWKEKGLSMKDMIHQDGRLLTLEQLEKKFFAPTIDVGDILYSEDTISAAIATAEKKAAEAAAAEAAKKAAEKIAKKAAKEAEAIAKAEKKAIKKAIKEAKLKAIEEAKAAKAIAKAEKKLAAIKVKPIEKVNAKVKKIEADLVKLDKENLVVISSKDGSVLLQKAGTETELSLGTEAEHLLWKDNIVTHNHPTAFFPSRQDFTSAHLYRTKEMRIVVNGGEGVGDVTFSIIPTTGKNADDFLAADLLKELSESSLKYRQYTGNEIIWKGVNNGTIPEDLLDLHVGLHAWEDIGKKYGFKISQVDGKDVNLFKYVDEQIAKETAEKAALEAAKKAAEEEAIKLAKEAKRLKEASEKAAKEAIEKAAKEAAAKEAELKAINDKVQEHIQSIKNPKKTVIFEVGKESPTIEALEKVDIPDSASFKPIKREDLKIQTKDIKFEPEYIKTPDKNVSTGIIVVEEDTGKVWIVEPKGHFGGYEHTFPKGTVETGSTILKDLQTTAIIETYEESGLESRIIGYLGDYEKTTSKTRYYIGVRTGGSPFKAGWESQGVKLLSPDKLDEYLNVATDKKIANDFKKLIEEAKAAKAAKKLDTLEDALDDVAKEKAIAEEVAEIKEEAAKLKATAAEEVKAALAAKKAETVSPYLISPEDVSEWVKDSKVKDILYHGTSKKSAENILEKGFVIDSEKVSGKFYGDGVYFTTNKAKAIKWGEATGPNPEIIESVVNVKKPYVLKTVKSTESLWKKIIKKGYDADFKGFTKYLDDLGYDSVIIEEMQEVVVFDLKKIRIIKTGKKIEDEAALAAFKEAEEKKIKELEKAIFKKEAPPVIEEIDEMTLRYKKWKSTALKTKAEGGWENVVKDDLNFKNATDVKFHFKNRYDINFKYDAASDIDFYLSKQTAEAFEIMAEKGFYTLPKTVKFDSKFFKEVYGKKADQHFAVCMGTGKNSIVYLNPESMTAGNPAAYNKLIENSYKIKHISSDLLAHPILHEMGAFYKKELIKSADGYFKAAGKIVASEVSGTAAKSMYSFSGEVFAGTIKGKKYSQTVYDKFVDLINLKAYKPGDNPVADDIRKLLSKTYDDVAKKAAGPPSLSTAKKAAGPPSLGPPSLSSPAEVSAVEKALETATEKVVDDAAALSKAMQEKIDFGEFKKIGPQKGSNPGGLYQDTVTGEKWYIKTPKTEDHVYNEITAKLLYKKLDIEVPDLVAVRLNGKLSVASRWVDDLSDVGSSSYYRFYDGFAADAWMANWDVAGMSFDNIALATGVPIRVDVGGSLLFRAQGALKGSDFGSVVGELESMKNKGTAAKLFAKIKKKDIEKGIAKIKALTDDEIRAIVSSAGWQDPAMEDQLVNILIARRNWMPTPKTVKKAAKAAPQAAVEEIVGEVKLTAAQKKAIDYVASKGSALDSELDTVVGMLKKYVIGNSDAEKLYKKIDTKVLRSYLDNLEKQMKDGTIEFRINRDISSSGKASFKGVYDTGEMKNQFQLGKKKATSGGYKGAYKGSERDDWEEILYGNELHQSAKYKKLSKGDDLSKAVAGERPIYGYVGIGNDAQSHLAGRYGNVSFILKPEVSNRLTMTYKNSSIFARSPLEGLVAIPDSKSMMGMIKRRLKDLQTGSITIEEALEEIINVSQGKAASLSFEQSYFEAQVFGGVRLDRDVKLIRIPFAKKERYLHIQSLADKYDLEIEYYSEAGKVVEVYGKKNLAEELNKISSKALDPFLKDLRGSLGEEIDSYLANAYDEISKGAVNKALASIQKNKGAFAAEIKDNVKEFTFDELFNISDFKARLEAMRGTDGLVSILQEAADDTFELSKQSIEGLLKKKIEKSVKESIKESVKESTAAILKDVKKAAKKKLGIKGKELKDLSEKITKDIGSKLDESTTSVFINDIFDSEGYSALSRIRKDFSLEIEKSFDGLSIEKLGGVDKFEKILKKRIDDVVENYDVSKLLEESAEKALAEAKKIRRIRATDADELYISKEVQKTTDKIIKDIQGSYVKYAENIRKNFEAGRITFEYALESMERLVSKKELDSVVKKSLAKGRNFVENNKTAFEFPSLNKKALATLEDDIVETWKEVYSENAYTQLGEYVSSKNPRIVRDTIKETINEYVKGVGVTKISDFMTEDGLIAKVADNIVDKSSLLIESMLKHRASMTPAMIAEAEEQLADLLGTLTDIPHKFIDTGRVAEVRHILEDEYGKKYLDPTRQSKINSAIKKYCGTTNYKDVRWYTGSGSDYSNRALRKGRDTYDREIASINKWLKNAPAVAIRKGEYVLRGTGFPKALVDDLIRKKAGSMVFKEFLSTTVDGARASNFVSDYGGDYGVMLHIKSKTAVSVKAISKFDYEEEYLIKSGTKFRIKSIEKVYPKYKEDPQFIFELEEI